MKRLAWALAAILIIAGVSIASRGMGFQTTSLSLYNIKTDSRWETLTPEKFRGCPNFFHRVQDPWRISVDPVWTDTMEQTFKIYIDKHAFQREHAS